MKQRILSLLLALVMALTLCVPALAAEGMEPEASSDPVQETQPAPEAETPEISVDPEPAPEPEIETALAADEPEEAAGNVKYSGTLGKLKWSLTTDGTLTISGNGPMEHVEWEKAWGRYNQSIRRVVVEEGVTTIGGDAFTCCENLTSVSLPDTLTTIGFGAFNLCYSLKQIDLPKNLVTIQDEAFWYTGLETVVVPASVKSLGAAALRCSGYDYGDARDASLLRTVTILNPNCKFYDYDGVVGTYVSTTIRGYAGSTAQAYARKYGYRFEVISEPQPTGGWRWENGAWYYYKNDKKVTNAWVKSGGKWYWLGADGVMATNSWVDGGKYYVNGSGVMQTGWVWDGGKWYYTDASGAMKTGWVWTGGKWYYMDPATGVMLTGLNTIAGKKYYFDASGAMKTGWVNVSGARYWFDSSGAMVEYGWIWDSGKWYWLQEDGTVFTGGILTIGGQDYCFDPRTGAMQTGWISSVMGNYYYANSSGVILKNAWLKYGGKWYYLGGNGLMYRTPVPHGAGEWKEIPDPSMIDGKPYRFDDSGAMQTGWIKLRNGDGPYEYCYANSSGVLQQNAWVKSGGKWYWMNSEYYMVHDCTLVIQGRSYSFNSSGACLNP